jgi:hypothetical protein
MKEIAGARPLSLAASTGIHASPGIAFASWRDGGLEKPKFERGGGAQASSLVCSK